MNQWCSSGGATEAIAPVPVFLIHLFLGYVAFILQKLAFDLNKLPKHMHSNMYYYVNLCLDITIVERMTLAVTRTQIADQ